MGIARLPILLLVCHAWVRNLKTKGRA